MPWEPVQSGNASALTPGNIATTALWLRADLGIVFGGMAPAVQNAGAAAAVTFTGVPTFGVTQSFEVTIDGPGARGVATFTWKRNGVVGGAGVLTAAAVLLADGVSANFPVHVYAVADDWTSVPAVTRWTSQDPSHTVFSQAVLASMPYWIAPGLALTGWPASINGQAGLRHAGGQELICAAFALAQPFMVSGVWSTSRAGTQGFFATAAGPYGYTNAAVALSFTDGANIEEVYASSAILSPLLAGFIYHGAASQFVGSGGPKTTLAGTALGGTLEVGALGGSDFLIGDVCEFWIDGEDTPPLTWGQVRQAWLARYGL